MAAAADLLVVLDWILPPCCLGCGVLVPAAALPALCRRCGLDVARLPPALALRDDTEALFAYDGALAAALTRLKYRGQTALAGPLGRALTLAHAWGEAWDMVVPVPMHPWRRILRGHDQVRLLFAAARRHRPGLPRERTDVLVRRRGAGQVGASREARHAHAQAVFALAPGAASRVGGASVLVLDDVTTTGATLAVCRQRLVQAGAARVGALALLRTLA